MYEVKIPLSVEKELEKLPKKLQIAIREKIDSLETNPRPYVAIKLKTSRENLYRWRQGDYRIVYQIRDHVLIVLIVAVDHRKDVYR